MQTYRGAPMGALEGRLYLRRVRVDRNGFDSNGGHRGSSRPIYHCRSVDDEISFYMVASDRQDAKAQVLKRFPSALFFN